MKSCHNNDTAWFSERDTEQKYVLYADQVKIGIRNPEDFTLFFTRPVRHNETAVYIDGVRLIQP